MGLNVVHPTPSETDVPTPHAPETPSEKVDILDNKAQWLTAEKLTAVLNSFGSFKAPGNDGIRPIVLKHLSTSAFLKLLDIFKACYLLGMVPSSWLISRVIFLPKPNKSCYDS